MKSIFVKSIFIYLLIAFVSCKKFVDVAVPKTQLVRQSVFTNDKSAIAAISDIYSGMADGSSYLYSLYPGLSSDEFINWDTNQESINFYVNNLYPTIGPAYILWGQAYSFIYEANAVLEGVNDSRGITPMVKLQLIGEAKFVRAFWFFYLTNLYGDIPLVLNTDYNSNSIISRVKQDDVYAQIINDLLEAKKLLSEKYLGPDLIKSTSEKLRPTKWAADALLARVYLYSNNYQGALDQCDEIISSQAGFNLAADLTGVFLKNSSEAIWQIQPATNSGYDTHEGLNFILTTTPHLVSMSEDFVGSFDSNDLRLKNWIGSYSNNGKTYYFPYKYKISSANTLSEYVMVFRLSEVYLIRAEAEAKLNNIVESKSNLDIIRNRAGVAKSIVNDQASLLLEIYDERKKELFAEWGHRWLDMKRTKTVDSIMRNVSIKKGGNWRSFQQLYPIPQKEILNDHNLTQNEGY